MNVERGSKTSLVQHVEWKAVDARRVKAKNSCERCDNGDERASVRRCQRRRFLVVRTDVLARSIQQPAHVHGICTCVSACPRACECDGEQAQSTGQVQAVGGGGNWCTLCDEETRKAGPSHLSICFHRVRAHDFTHDCPASE